MHFKTLQGSNLRCFAEFSLTPILGVNLLLGENGAGKTSLLEALYILGYGRSFRGRIRDGLIKQGQRHLQLTARWQAHTDGPEQQGGIQHGGGDWQARLNGETVDNLSQFCKNFPVLCFEPGSHELISGTSEHRRRFMDWALFHVEPDFYPHWRRFNRALKQRNALLKTQPSAKDLAPWDIEFAEAGEVVNQYRKAYLAQLFPYFSELAHAFLPEGEQAEMQFICGWREELALQDALRINLERDRAAGFCTIGPHRADWKTRMNQQMLAEHFSRGQAKLLALAALMAQAQHFHAQTEIWPVLCFDDLASELDQRHLNGVLAHLAGTAAQIWISGTHAQQLITPAITVYKQFHVEHSTVKSID